MSDGKSKKRGAKEQSIIIICYVRSRAVTNRIFFLTYFLLYVHKFGFLSSVKLLHIQEVLSNSHLIGYALYKMDVTSWAYSKIQIQIYISKMTNKTSNIYWKVVFFVWIWFSCQSDPVNLNPNLQLFKI